VFEKSPVAFLDELAQNVGGTKRWWADQARAGKIPARKVGGHWCLTREDLAEALESFRSNAGPMPRPTDDDLGLTETARRRTSG
jgi:excisionase family DNA binding protein